MLMHVLTTLSGVFFFFQAEDGIRDLTVTGVQTCALPILVYNSAPSHRGPEPERRHAAEPESRLDGARRHGGGAGEIGRGAGRGRGEVSVGAGSLKKKKKPNRLWPAPGASRPP